MSHLLKRTKKSCLKLLRKISTSKQFVQRLEDDEEDEDEEPKLNLSTKTAHEKQYKSSNSNQKNNKPNPSVQYFEYACEADSLEQQEQLELEVQQTPMKNGIEFQRVQYKENVRYLRHTPSNSSLDLSYAQHEEPAPAGAAMRTPPARKLRACSVSLGSQFDGQYHSVIIMEQPPHEDYPIVKWDINGNSLDEEQEQQWLNFDTRWRQQALPAAKQRLGSAQSQRSSHHSSSCTLETWIDDAELESQYLLHNNNNNCNLCLKSF
ncbi:CG11191 [Drosophila busckii]|uniref:CG11191 n=1 Tax=Drosophila busckii TaxID=30019 RepID=A0A0M3QUP5_DROBS|nr:uncharacterized protein LOC108595702 [Drosophila busckii]ALC41029.1 CG11191 [Drosophila busckii]